MRAEITYGTIRSCCGLMCFRLTWSLFSGVMDASANILHKLISSTLNVFKVEGGMFCHIVCNIYIVITCSQFFAVWNRLNRVLQQQVRWQMDGCGRWTQFFYRKNPDFFVSLYISALLKIGSCAAWPIRFFHPKNQCQKTRCCKFRLAGAALRRSHWPSLEAPKICSVQFRHGFKFQNMFLAKFFRRNHQSWIIR